MPHRDRSRDGRAHETRLRLQKGKRQRTGLDVPPGGLVLKQDVEDRDLQRRLTRKVREWDQQAKPIDNWDAMMHKAAHTARRA